jgi:hypothetical protein
MPSHTVLLDLRSLPPGQQVDHLKEQYRLLRGKDAVVRARVGALPVRQYLHVGAWLPRRFGKRRRGMPAGSSVE